MQKTRQSILSYLTSNPGSSAVDLARAMEMTPANIRYHLNFLLDEGKIQISGTRSAGGAGRPLSLYHLSPEKLGDSLQPLLAAFLEASSEQGSDAVLEKVGEKLGEIKAGQPLNRIKRYNQAVEYLNELHYHASWEARPEGPRVELRHCPYKDLALSHPRICVIDQRLISKLFAAPMVMTQKKTFGKNPFSPCVFQRFTQ